MESLATTLLAVACLALAATGWTANPTAGCATTSAAAFVAFAVVWAAVWHREDGT